MTLTVRLNQQLEEALEQYSAEHGLTKSQVVQESLAEYLVRRKKKVEALPAGEVSETYRAFRKAGLIGCVKGLGGSSATKEVIRERAMERLSRKR